MLKGLKNGAVSFALWLWQLPQNFVGWLLVCAYRPETSYDLDGVRVYRATRMKGGISLGRYVIISARNTDTTTEKHEYGHTRQSLILGPLYLFVIGIPSILWAAWWNKDRGVSYYSFYTEKWADKLGKINRK